MSKVREKYFRVRGQKGSALLFVVMMAAVSAFTIASMQTYIVNSQRREYLRTDKIKFKNMLKSLKKTVENQGFCNVASTGILDGNVKLQGANLDSVEGPLKLRFNHNGVDIDLRKNWVSANGHIKVTGMRLEYISTWGLGQHTFATSNIISKRAQYHLIIEALICKDVACAPETSQAVTNKRRDTDGQLSPYGVDIILNIRFQAKKVGTSVVSVNNGLAVSCFGSASGAAQCENMGGIWNPFSGNVQTRCEPHNGCYKKNISGGVCPAEYTKFYVGKTKKITSSRVELVGRGTEADVWGEWWEWEQIWYTYDEDKPNMLTQASSYQRGGWGRSVSVEFDKPVFKYECLWCNANAELD